jgi:hypothetical protein
MLLLLLLITHHIYSKEREIYIKRVSLAEGILRVSIYI